MLTWSDLEALCHTGKLMRWEAKPPRAGFNRRFLYLDADVHEQLTQRPWPAAPGEPAWRTRGRRQAMRSMLERFVRGEALNLSRDIKELGTRDRNPAMRGFWEFRSQGDRHETRLFGFFARPTAFIGVTFRSKEALGDDKDYEDEHANCKVLWRALANRVRPIDSPWPVNLKIDLKAYTDE